MYYYEASYTKLKDSDTVNGEIERYDTNPRFKGTMCACVCLCVSVCACVLVCVCVCVCVFL